MAHITLDSWGLRVISDAERKQKRCRDFHRGILVILNCPKV